MNARERFNKLLSYADSSVALALVEKLAGVTGDALVDARAEAVRTAVNMLGDQVRVQALESVDRWSTVDVSKLMSMYSQRADELREQTRNALHRVTATEVVQPLQHTVREEMRWLFKNIQLMVLPDCRWTLLADDSCPTCAALARAGVADKTALAYAWADDYCGSTLVVIDTAEVNDVGGWLRVTGVPRQYTRAVAAYTDMLRRTWAPLLVDRGELGFVDKVDAVHGLSDDLAASVVAHRHADTGAWHAQWSPATWRFVVATAAVDDKKLPLDQLRRGYEELLTGDEQVLSLTAHGVFDPNRVINPLACCELGDYARACAVALLVDPVRLKIVDPRAHDVLCEYVDNADPMRFTGGEHRD